MADEFIISIDIGTSKTVVMVAEEVKGKLQVKGYAENPSLGVDKGLITDIDLVSKVIKKTMKEVGESCDRNLSNANVSINISDACLSVINHSSPLRIKGKITKNKVISAIELASAVTIPANNAELHSVVNDFIINDGSPDSLVTHQPIGMEAQTLKANMHIVSVSERNVENVMRGISTSDLGAKQIVLDSMAISEAYISKEEKENGVCLVDIGAGVSNFSIFIKGGLAYSAIVPLGGNKITEDIAYAFDTSLEQAESLKIEHGHVQVSLPKEDKLIEFFQNHNSQERYLSSYDLIEVVKKSYSKLFSDIRKEINSKKYNLKAGFVLTGGASKIPGCAELFMKSTSTKTKLGRVNENRITGNVAIISNPIYASALGLLLYEGNESYLEVVQLSEKTGLLDKIKGKFREF